MVFTHYPFLSLRPLRRHRRDGGPAGCPRNAAPGRLQGGAAGKRCDGEARQTMDRYSHTVIGELAADLDVLPSAEPNKPAREVAVAKDTGTDDVTPAKVAAHLQRAGYVSCPTVSRGDTVTELTTAMQPLALHTVHRSVSVRVVQRQDRASEHPPGTFPFQGMPLGRGHATEGG